MTTKLLIKTFLSLNTSFKISDFSYFINTDDVISNKINTCYDTEEKCTENKAALGCCILVIVALIFFNNIYLGKCAVISHWGFICIFLMISEPISHLYTLFGEILTQVLTLLLVWLLGVLSLNCVSYLHIFKIDPTSDVQFVSIFFHSVSCLFTLFSFLCFTEDF